MDGFLNLLKPPGMTSHDVIDVVRRVTKVRQVGHTGTLDPGAAGVMVVAVGFAARLKDYLADTTKSYRAEIAFGVQTDTGDAQGEIAREMDSSQLTERIVLEQMRSFNGVIEQRPPAYSAVQVGGARMHRLARQGKSVVAPLRQVVISRFELARFQPGERATALVDVDCSTGAYMRVLATDLGALLGCGAHLSFLLRTRVGQFSITDSITLETLMETRESEMATLMISPQRALLPIPTMTVTGEQERRVRSGNPITVEAGVAVSVPQVLIASEDGRVLGVARRVEREGSAERTSNRVVLQPVKVIPEAQPACA